MPVATPAPTSHRPDDTKGPHAVPVDNTDGANNADGSHQQSHDAASSESWDRRVTQSPLMSASTDGLALRKNAPTSDSSDDTRDPDAAPADNFVAIPLMLARGLVTRRRVV